MKTYEVKLEGNESSFFQDNNSIFDVEAEDFDAAYVKAKNEIEKRQKKEKKDLKILSISIKTIWGKLI